MRKCTKTRPNSEHILKEGVIGFCWMFRAQVQEY